MTEPLVLVPGLGSDGAVWRRTIAALAHEVECSVGDTLSDDSLPGMAARVLEAAPERFALAGVSMGGMVALEIMRAAPDRVTRLALADTNARPDTPEQAAYRRGVNQAMLATEHLARLSLPAIRAMVGRDADPSVHEELVAMTLRVGREAYVRQNKAVAARADLRPVLPTVQVPTLVVVGAEDSMTPVALSEEIRDAISGAELHVLPGCGHLPPIEQPQVMADLLRRWLDRPV